MKEKRVGKKNERKIVCYTISVVIRIWDMFFKIKSDEKHYKLTWFCGFYFSEFQKMNVFTVFIFQKLTENHKNRENVWLQNFLPLSYFKVLWFLTGLKKVQVIHRYKKNLGHVIANSPKFTHGLMTLNSPVLLYEPMMYLNGTNFHLY